MAEEKQYEEITAVQPKKSGMKLIIIIAVVVIAVAGGFAGYSGFIAKGKPEDAQKKETNIKTKGALIPVDPFIVNLTDHGRYIKVTMQFEVADASNQEMVKQKVPNLRDAVITLLSSKSLDSISGPDGKFQLKDELLLRANNAMGGEVFKNIYFTEFVIQ